MTGGDPRARRPAGEWIAQALGMEGKEMTMKTEKSASVLATDITSRAIQITFAALLGMFVIAGAGFVQISAVHNAGHDYRHSMGFPCH